MIKASTFYSVMGSLLIGSLIVGLFVLPIGGAIYTVLTRQRRAKRFKQKQDELWARFDRNEITLAQMNEMLDKYIDDNIPLGVRLWKRITGKR